MQIVREKVRKYIQFLLEDANKPGVLLNLDGTVIQTNNLFQEKFNSKQISNIKELLDENSIIIWDEFADLSNKDERTTFEMGIQCAPNITNSIKVSFIYFGYVKQLIAFLNLPKQPGSQIEKTYINAFRKSENFMILSNQSGTILDVNEMNTDFFNLPRDYFIGKQILEITPVILKQSNEIQSFIEKVKGDGFAELSIKHEPTPGDKRYYKITTYFDDETLLYFTQIKDQTKQVQLEKQLAHKGSLTAIGQLAASIAHEIRNPMTTLKGFTQLLKVSATEESMKYLAVIDDEIGRMESILSEMLILSRPGENEKTTISLLDILSDIVRVVYPKALMDNISIVQTECANIDVRVFGNADKIKQMLLNLLKNAIEAMTSGGTLTLGIEEGENGQIILVVSDTGKGISKNKMKQIFMPFYTSKTEGTGLGLPFVLKTIEEHGGTIAVESEVDSGTKFILSFPPAIAHVREETVEQGI